MFEDSDSAASSLGAAAAGSLGADASSYGAAAGAAGMRAGAAAADTKGHWPLSQLQSFSAGPGADLYEINKPHNWLDQQIPTFSKKKKKKKKKKEKKEKEKEKEKKVKAWG